MQDSNTTSLQPTVDIEVRQREIAHQLWEDEGRPEGKAEEHWERAGLIIMDLDAKAEKLPTWLQKTSDAEESATAAALPAAEQDLSSAIQDLRRRMTAKSAA